MSVHRSAVRGYHDTTITHASRGIIDLSDLAIIMYANSISSHSVICDLTQEAQPEIIGMPTGDVL
jgi:hypothetical protein